MRKVVSILTVALALVLAPMAAKARAQDRDDASKTVDALKGKKQSEKDKAAAEKRAREDKAAAEKRAREDRAAAAKRDRDDKTKAVDALKGNDRDREDKTKTVDALKGKDTDRDRDRDRDNDRDRRAGRSPAARIVKGPVIEYVGPTDAVIAWTTNTNSSSVLRYGTMPGMLSQSAQKPWGGTNHRLKITGLRPNTTYYFQVESQHAQGTGTEARSNALSFRTPAKGRSEHYPKAGPGF